MTPPREPGLAAAATPPLPARISNMAGRGLRTIILAALLAAVAGCVEEQGRALLEAGEPSALSAGGVEGEATAGTGSPPLPGSGNPPAAAPRRGGGSTAPPAAIPMAPLLQPLVGSGADSHAAECDPFDDPFGACI